MASNKYSRVRPKETFTKQLDLNARQELTYRCLLNRAATSTTNRSIYDIANGEYGDVLPVFAYAQIYSTTIRALVAHFSAGRIKFWKFRHLVKSFRRGLKERVERTYGLTEHDKICLFLAFGLINM